jgi:hypothetical protein
MSDLEGIKAGKGERLYSKKEVKAKKTISGVGGFLTGAIATLVAAVVLNKAAHVNVADVATNLADKGIDKIKKLPEKFKKEEKTEEVKVEIVDSE